jgi:hypothetical protein
MAARFAVQIQKAFVIVSPHWGITRRMLFHEYFKRFECLDVTAGEGA